MTEKFGPFQQAANKLKQFAIDNKVLHAGELALDGQLGADWKTSLESIMGDDNLRPQFDYGILREVRDALIHVRGESGRKFGRWGFVGSIGQTNGHFDFLDLVAKKARQEAAKNIAASALA